MAPALHCAVASCPVQKLDGTLEQRTKGTLQGGVVSPLLANLSLHYAFDVWMRRFHPSSPFERSADCAVIHSEVQTVAASKARIDALAGMHRATGAEFIRALAARRPAWGVIVGAG